MPYGVASFLRLHLRRLFRGGSLALFRTLSAHSAQPSLRSPFVADGPSRCIRAYLASSFPAWLGSQPGVSLSQPYVSPARDYPS